MMKLIILIPLLLMIVSDYKFRTIVLWQLIFFGIIMLGISLIENGLMTTLLNISLNILISFIVGLCVYFYFLIKYRSVYSIIGKGDILFILFLTPFFPPRMFLIFMFTSFIATLFMWIVISLIKKSGDKIPLVSGIGVCLSVLLVYNFLV